MKEIRLLIHNTCSKELDADKIEVFNNALQDMIFNRSKNGELSVDSDFMEFNNLPYNAEIRKLLGMDNWGKFMYLVNKEIKQITYN